MAFVKLPRGYDRLAFWNAEKNQAVNPRSSVALEQRGVAPAKTWRPSWLPRLTWYALALRVDGRRATPLHVRVAIQWRDVELWFYVWPARPRRGGLRRLVENPAWMGLGPAI